MYYIGSSVHYLGNLILNNYLDKTELSTYLDSVIAYLDNFIDNYLLSYHDNLEKKKKEII